jgi:hypothetical protein
MSSTVVEDDPVAFGNARSMPEHHNDLEDFSDGKEMVYNKEDMTQYSRHLGVNRLNTSTDNYSTKVSRF